MTILRTHGLGKQYGDTLAVDSLDLAVEPGEMFGLLGPNGAGKTTAISMICGVITPSRGTAVIGGHDIAKEPFAARRALGYVPQDLALYEELSARQNLMFFGRLYGLAGAELQDRVAWALDVAGLQDRAREPVSRFSGGMKRRLNLAAGLLHRPRLLVLDEPTVGVDPQSKHYIFETVRALQRDHAMTVLYTSHYMDEVQALCSRVAIMDRGKLIALERVDDLIAAHGSSTVEIELDAPPGTNPTPDALAETVRAALAPLQAGSSGTIDLAWSGATLRVQAPGKLGPVITAVEESGVLIRSIHSLEPDLETVFLTLTGKRLRDD